jgi:hypothetical protein
MSKQLTLANLGTSEETTAGDITFQIPGWMFRNNSKPSLVCAGITGAETVTLWHADGSGFQQTYDDQGDAAQLDPTNSKTSITLNTPGLFSVTHSALAAARKLRVLFG